MKGLRLAQANCLEAAQAYLEQEYLPQWNQTFTRVPAGSTDAHRPLRAEHQLAAILSHVEDRFVTADYTIRYQGRIYRIAREDIRPGLRSRRVRVEQRLDGSLTVKFRQYALRVVECPARPKTPPPPKPLSAPKPRPKVTHNWMKNFHLHQSPPWGVILASERAEVGPDTG